MLVLQRIQIDLYKAKKKILEKMFLKLFSNIFFIHLLVGLLAKIKSNNTTYLLKLLIMTGNYLFYQ